ncbi:MAG: class I SAM-dependent methyltransferase [Pseudanabaenaceae cyanobacterium bins.39]|nr:class I SAM-dependent methyltransferase [Pseudanabaenaceae cyanobacterium bins.39]
MYICPTCKYTEHKDIYAIDQGKLISCQNCKLVFYVPRPTAEELTNFYNHQAYRQDYAQSVMSSPDFVANRYQDLKQIVSKYDPHLFNRKDKIFLDIGCGLGSLLQQAIADQWQVQGTEISPEAVLQANIDIRDRILVGDILSLDLPEQYFDLITIYHVIEHLIDPMAVLNKIQKLLKPDGILFIETPNLDSLGAKIRGKNWSNIIPPEHINYYNPKSIANSLKVAGFAKFKVFTNTPYKIESISKWSKPIQTLARSIYQITPIFGMGAALQAVVFSSSITKS